MLTHSQSPLPNRRGVHAVRPVSFWNTVYWHADSILGEAVREDELSPASALTNPDDDAAADSGLGLSTRAKGKRKAQG